MGNTKLTRRSFALHSAALLCTAAFSEKLPAANPARPKVYFARRVVPENFIAIFDRLRADAGLHRVNGRIGIKLHGDEVELNRNLWQALQRHVPGSFFVECNYASVYPSGRGNTQGNIDAIVRQGVSRDVIDVLDRDGAYRDVPVKNGFELKSVSVPKAIGDEYGLIAVAANFKLRSFAGYSGALKNVGIGLAGSYGKTTVHGPEMARDAGFFRRLADAGKAIASAYAGKLFYINVLTDIEAEPLQGLTMNSGDLGIVGSLDMTAADQAALDLIYGLRPDQYNAFEESVKIDRGFLQLEHLAYLGFGSRSYEKIEI